MSPAATILVVDDDPGACETIGDILLLKGFEVVTARSGRAALDVVGARPIAAALVDLKLPDLSGIQLLDEIKASSPATEVIVVTGHGSLGTAIEAINGAAFAYLTKPVEVDHLLASLKRALERGRLTEALQRSEERYRLVTEQIADAVFLLDLEARPIFVNPRVVALTGYTPDELEQRSVFDLLAPDDAERARSRVCAAEQSGAGATTFEAAIRCKDGREVWVEATITSVIKDGHLVGRLGVARDITERKQLEAQLRQAQKLDAVGRLAGGIAHDFNNLLTVIGGRTHLMGFRLGADDPLRRDLAIIDATCDRAAGLTRQLLAFSKNQVLAPRVLEIGEVVANMGGMLQRLLGEDIELDLAIASPPARVRVDLSQLEQVLLNLAVNARDAMPGGGRLTIATEVVALGDGYARTHVDIAPGSYVRLRVTDTGHGMDEATRAQLFVPFFTTKEAGKGTGLGLATVYGIVTQSGGHIDVESAPGKGATFSIHLPRVEEPIDAIVGTLVSATPPRGTEIVLLAEDDAEVRAMARETLEGCGYRVLDGGSTVEAIRIAKQHPDAIDLLLTDVVMPGMSGRALAAAIAPFRPGIKVLFMSGYTADAMKQHGLQNAPLAFLQKPFTPLALALRVREVLDEPAPARRTR